MSQNYVTLVGAEDVSNAGYNMKQAADEMSQAANQITEALRQHQEFMNEWLERFKLSIMSG